ncbi:hypothetical protein RB653_006026 [Dictyostelium firmibasis]|uniref:Uncharacterized protein n=1 Tax=Dictyostelium firmibasis TaxID=79012 RepID=A0AAN7UDR6_9MYCE
MLEQGSEKEIYLATIYNREVAKLEGGSKPPVKKICSEFLKKYPGPSINSVIGDLTNLRKRKNNDGYIVLKDPVPKFSDEQKSNNTEVTPVEKKPKISIDPPALTSGDVEKPKEKEEGEIFDIDGSKYLLLSVNGKREMVKIPSTGHDQSPVAPNSPHETKAGEEKMKSGGSPNIGQPEDLLDSPVMPRVKLEKSFMDLESVTSASGMEVNSKNNGSGTYTHPYSLSDCSSDTVIADNNNNLFHRMVKIDSYYSLGGVQKRFYLLFPKLLHIKLETVVNDIDENSIKFIFKNILSREDIETGIKNIEDHRLAKKYQEEVSDIQVVYKYPPLFNISNIEKIGVGDRLVKVVGAAIYYVDAGTLRKK